MPSYEVIFGSDDLRVLLTKANTMFEQANFQQFAEIAADKDLQIPANNTDFDGDFSGFSPDGYLCNAASAPITFTLPPAGTNLELVKGRMIFIKKIDASANAVTITPDQPSETIEGATTYTLTTQYQGVRIFSTGSEWLIYSTT